MTKLSFAGPRPTPTPAPPLQLFKQPVQLTFTQVEGRPTKKGLRRYLQWQIRLSSLFRLHCSRKSGEVPQHPPFPVVVKERVLYFGSIESKQWFPSTNQFLSRRRRPLRISAKSPLCLRQPIDTLFFLSHPSGIHIAKPFTQCFFYNLTSYHLEMLTAESMSHYMSRMVRTYRARLGH